MCKLNLNKGLRKMEGRLDGKKGYISSYGSWPPRWPSTISIGWYCHPFVASFHIYQGLSVWLVIAYDRSDGQSHLILGNKGL